MSLNPQAEQLLALFAEMGGDVDIAKMTPEAARAARTMPESSNVIPVEQCTELSIDCGDHAVAARSYQPEGSGPFPIMVYFHGGGWVLCDLETHDNLCRALCVAANCVVLSVDYRLAPECKFPGPFDDCFDATTWAYEHAAELNADPNKIIVAGDSAGGNLATAVAIKARDERQAGRPAPLIAYQLLIYPVTDFNFDNDSYRENATGKFLTTETMRWFWGHYLASDDQGTSAYASPLQAKSLRSMPPALIVTAECDPLCDEGEAYAERLLADSVKAELIRYKGQIHGFVSMFEMLDDGASAIETMGDKLKEFFQ